MSENILENITGIELGSMTMDDGMPSTVLTIKTKKSNYVFRLSESFPTEKQINIFRAMVMDLQSDMVEEKRKETLHRIIPPKHNPVLAMINNPSSRAFPPSLRGGQRPPRQFPTHRHPLHGATHPCIKGSLLKVRSTASLFQPPITSQMQ